MDSVDSMRGRLGVRFGAGHVPTVRVAMLVTLLLLPTVTPFCNVTLSASTTISADIYYALGSATDPGPFTVCLQHATYTGCNDTAFPVSMRTAAGYPASLHGILSGSGERPLVDCELDSGFITVSPNITSTVSVSNIEFTSAANADSRGSVCDCTAPTLTTSVSVHFTNVVFSNNIQPVYLYGCEAVFDACHFRDNYNPVSTSGSIHAQSTTLLNVTDSTFTRESSDGNGGAVHAHTVVAVTISNTTVVECTAPDDHRGGALSFEFCGNVVLHSNLFLNNTAHYGGGVAFYDSDALSSVNDTFIGNLGYDGVNGEGGAFYQNGGIATFVHARVVSNTATFSGGFHLTTDSATGPVTHVVDSLFDSNLAYTEGGAVLIGGGGYVVANTTTFSNNISPNYGGGVSLFNSCTGYFYNSLFEANSAKYGGGVAAKVGTAAVIEGCTFKSNTADVFAGAGGALHLSSNAVVSVKNSEFNNNDAYFYGGDAYVWPTTQITMDGCNFTYAHALLGGSMYSNGDVSLTNCLITGVSSQKGGALYATSGSSFSARDSMIQECEVTEEGGALYVLTGSADLVNTTVKDCTATKFGGGVYVNGGTIGLNSSVIKECAALLQGGGLYVYGGEIQLSDAVVEGNFAIQHGGGVALENGVVWVSQRSSFRGNTAGTGYAGSFAYIDGDGGTVNMTLAGDTISCNAGESVFYITRTDPVDVRVVLRDGSGVFGNYKALANGGFDFDLGSPASVTAPVLATYSVGNFTELSFTGYVAPAHEDARNCSNAPPCELSVDCEPGVCVFGPNTDSRFIECNCGATGFGGTNCSVNLCGNAVVDSAVEECDDANGVDGDGCDNNCQFSCGNGGLDVGEECDDGNESDNDNCTTSCVVNYCGDGVTTPGIGEVCDDGNTVNGDGCDTNCTLSCGNGVVDAANSETCDDGNSIDTDGCSNTCQVPSTNATVPTAASATTTGNSTLSTGSGSGSSSVNGSTATASSLAATSAGATGSLSTSVSGGGGAGGGGDSSSGDFDSPVNNEEGDDAEAAERRRIFVTFIVSGLVVTLLVSLVVLLFLVRQRSKVRDIAWPLILEGGVEVKSVMSFGEEASDSDKGSQVPGSSSE